MEIKNSGYQFGNFTLMVDEHSLQTDHKEIYLRPKLFETLFFLIERNGHVVRKNELLNAVWPNVIVTENTIYKCIEELRRILRDKSSKPRFIQTIPRMGFKFIAEVKKVSSYSLAVLPFSNMSGNSNQDYFADGITEALIAELSKILSIRVISRTSVMVYKKILKPLPEIANELNVDLVVEGSVQCSGNNVQIIAQLIHAQTDKHLWTEIYEGDIQSIRFLQRTIASSIAGEIKSESVSGQKYSTIEQVVPAAYEAYLKGRYYWNKRTSAGFRKGIEYFERAVQKEPGYASAYVGLADCYNMLSNYDILPSKEVYPKVKEAITKALNINNNLAEAYTSRAFVRMFYEWNWKESENDLQRAIGLNPNCADGHHWYGLCLAIQKRFDESLKEMDEALSLDPLSMIINTNVGWILYFARRYSEAIMQLQQALEFESNFVSGHVKLGWVYEQLGDYEEAINQFQTALKIDNSPALEAILGHSFALTKQKDKALKIIKHLKERSKSQYVTPYLIANIYAGLEDKENAMSWLRNAYQTRDGWIAWLNVDPKLDLLRSDPEFNKLSKSIGF
jgi:TolB-like protein/Tfp pilus assembly protein PilF